MAEAGIFIVMKVAAGIAGILATSPLGEGGVPRDPLLDVSAGARPGYDLVIEDGSGSPIGRLRSGAPLPVELDKLPAHFVDAVIAAEDERFLEHPGVDPAAVAAALRDNLAGRLRGGSGLAQQTVKNTVLGGAPTLHRKAVEAMLALRLRQNAGEREVLRRYLQSAWFGRGVTGAMEAPEAWFGRSWAEVSLAQSATLAAMLKGPRLYDPLRNPERVRQRRDAILAIMEAKGWVSAAEAEAARSEPVSAIPAPEAEAGDPWIIAAARAEVAKIEPGLPRAGSARSTIDPAWQAIAGEVLAERLRKVSPVIAPAEPAPADLDAIRAALTDSDPANDVLPAHLHLDLPPGSPYRSMLILDGRPGHWNVLSAAGLERDVSIEDPHPGWKPRPGAILAALPLGATGDSGGPEGVRQIEVRLPTAVEGAIVIIDPRDGRLLASVGGVDPGLSGFDRTRGLRQPGSAIKPFLYLAALERGFAPADTVEDLERSYSGPGGHWRPRNYDHRQLGRIPMFTALERSSNLAAAWLASEIGIEEMAFRAEAAGAYPEGGMKRLLPSALGASDTTLLDLTAGFATLANGGLPRMAHSLEALRDREGRVLGPGSPVGAPAASPGAIDDLLGMMRGVITRGTASLALSDLPVMLAGKTGTSQNHRDAWFLGVTPHLAIGVWLGRDDAKPMPGTMAGGSDAAPIAGEVLRGALAAGLIDGDGLRDDEVPRVTWPPRLHEASDPPRVPAGDTVWVSEPIPGEEMSRERPDYEAGPVNRNADLLDFTF